MLQSVNPVFSRKAAAAVGRRVWDASGRTPSATMASRSSLTSAPLSAIPPDMGPMGAGSYDPPVSRDDVATLLEGIGQSYKEVRYWLKHYSQKAAGPAYAVVKVGGGVIDDPVQLHQLTESISFLRRVGLFPIILHGGGPQLNRELAARGIESEYEGGIRVTTPEILAVARRVFLQQNLRLVEALQDKGTVARPISSAVFEARLLDESVYGKVGDITSVDVGMLHSSVSCGAVPVLFSMGETASGQCLNVNADVAARALSEAVQPLKVVYINETGGLRDEHDRLIPNINVPQDVEAMMGQAWVRHGTRLKLKEIAALLEAVPAHTTVSVTSASSLMKELFTNQGAGTLFRKTERMHKLRSVAEADVPRLRRLLERSFGREVQREYLESLDERVDGIYVSESYRGAAVITREPGCPDVPYMCKFAVDETSQGHGLGQALWHEIQQDYPRLFWRSRSANKVNTWYFHHADGSRRVGDWTVFWYGIDVDDDEDAVVSRMLRTARAVPPSFHYDRDAPPHATRPAETALEASVAPLADTGAGGAEAGGLSGGADAAEAGPDAARGSAARGHPAAGGDAVSGAGLHVAGGAAKKRCAVIGARGYVGAELLDMLACHPGLEVAVASSRQMEGRPVREALAEDSVARGAYDPEMRFVNLSPEDAAAYPEAIDVWFLALPNGKAAEFVAAIDARPSGLNETVVDLSADFRFDDSRTWAYGQPETNRAALAGARRIANPGCYATGAQLALRPLAGDAPGPSLRGPPSVFGVSGYSGAGTTPSDKNNPVLLRDNLMPYALTGHIHEAEVSRHLGHAVHFMPHVGQHFRGISLTVSATLDRATTRDEVLETYSRRYAAEALVRVREDTPWVSQIAGLDHVDVGGFTLSADGKRVVVVATIDNLRKGAATQAIQNANLSLGMNELAGIPLAFTDQ